MSENLNIDMAAMLRQMTPEMQVRMQVLMQNMLQEGGRVTVQQIPAPIPKDYSSLEKQDVSCITCKKDFLDEGLYKEVYSGLYKDIAGGTVARADISNVEYLLSEKAYELGKTKLERPFKKKASEYKKQMKQEYNEMI